MKFTIATVLALAATAFAYPAVEKNGTFIWHPVLRDVRFKRIRLTCPSYSTRQASEYRREHRPLGFVHDGCQRERDPF